MKSQNLSSVKVVMKDELIEKMKAAIAGAKERLRVSYLAGVQKKKYTPNKRVSQRAGGSSKKKHVAAYKSKSAAKRIVASGECKNKPAKADKAANTPLSTSEVKTKVASGECKNVDTGKKLPASLNGFLRADQEPEIPVNTFRLPGEIGEFLGDLQRYKLAITLSGSRGAGKTWFAADIINAFLSAGFTAGLFSIEQGGMESKDTKAAIDHNVLPQNKPRLAVTGEAKNGIETVKQYADQFDLIVIDSWQKLGLPNTAFDRLRQEHPNTMWLVIFQQNAQGGQRNGVAAEFDAPIVLRAVTVDRTGKQNYVIADKNRGNQIDRKYMIHDKRTEMLYDDLLLDSDDASGSENGETGQLNGLGQNHSEIIDYFNQGQKYLLKVHLKMLGEKYQLPRKVIGKDDDRVIFDGGIYMPALHNINDVTRRSGKLTITSNNGSVVEEYVKL